LRVIVPFVLAPVVLLRDFVAQSLGVVASPSSIAGGVSSVADTTIVVVPPSRPRDSHYLAQPNSNSSYALRALLIPRLHSSLTLHDPFDFPT
ncbi:hypothetical protein L195_g061862, partial [Trifolium pratense]